VARTLTCIGGSFTTNAIAGHKWSLGQRHPVPRMSSDGPLLGDDILDLSAVGGSWERLFESIAPDHPLMDPLILYLATGELPPSPATPPGASVHLPSVSSLSPRHQIGDEIHDIQTALLAAPRTRLAIIAAMSPEARDRFYTLRLSGAESVTASIGGGIRVEELAALAGEGPSQYMIGRLSGAGSDRVELWPVAIVTGGELVNLATPISRPTAADGPADDSPTMPDRPTDDSSTVSARPADHLDRLTARIVGLADRGRRPSTSADLSSLATTASNRGFTALGDVIVNAPTELDGILRAAWMAQLLRDLDG